MSTFWRRHDKIGRRSWAIVAAMILMGWALPANAAVTLTAHPDPLPTPEEADLFTVDPFVSTPNANRNIATTAAEGQRNLRQTFQLAESLDIGDMYISINTQASNPGLQMRIYEVENTNAAWAGGTPIRSFVFPSVPDTANAAAPWWLKISFTGGDVFNLPARNTGTQGYGLEFSDNSGIVGNAVGLLYFTNPATTDPPTDYYTGGRYFSENASFASRDIGLILVGTEASPCAAGDVNCDTLINEIDLGIIAGHFRQNGSREQGDLTSDGFIDFDDFHQWKTNYTGPPLGAGAFSFLSVPEPTTATLLVLGLAAIGFRRRRMK